MPPEPTVSPSSTQTDYDLFISYARKDNAPLLPAHPRGWVTGIYEHILADHRTFSTTPLRIFFDRHEIKDADDWRHRILGALRHSKILLVCLSPSYFASQPCRWEWEEYIQRQVHRLMGSESVATVYFVELPGSLEQQMARWGEELLRGNFTDLRPWFPEGAEALQKEDVRQRLAALGATLWERLQRARRALAVPGNLRWQNPHFVGRTAELRRLHEQLGVGAVGVVTAVQGLGGQGKTELAVAYAHGYADAYPAGLWSIGAEGAKELLPLLGALAWERALGFTPSEAEKNDPALLGRGVLAHLQARGAAVRAADPEHGAACLILLDNVSEPELLSAAQLATLPGGLGSDWLRIVATTRLDVAPQKARLAVVAVDALDEDSALALVRDHQPFRDAQGQPVDDPEQSVPRPIPAFAGAAEENAAREIVRVLGGFTLAVEQVALYLGLHPDVTPSAFLATLQSRGLPVADALPLRDADVAAQMRTQSKQLALILETTLARLSAPERTALAFAALLPPDTVPWPWLRALTAQVHPEIGKLDDLGADPWVSLQRRLRGLRLLTPGDHPEIARIHRLVAAHLAASPTEPPLSAALDAFLGRRADHLYRSPAAPADWELDALIATLPPRLGPHSDQALANDALFLTEKIVTYRTLPAAAEFLAAVHRVLSALAASDPANVEWQRDLSVSLNMIGESAMAQGDLAAAMRFFSECHATLQRLAVSDPASAEWPRDLSVSLEKLGNLAVAQGDLAAAARFFSECHTTLQRLAASDPANAAWQRDLSVSLIKLGELAATQGDLAAATRFFSETRTIRERLTASDPANAAWQRDLSVALEKLGDLAVAQGDLAAAARLFSEARTIAERLAASDPANAAWQRDLSVALEKLGDLAVVQGDLTAAAHLFFESRAIAERLAANDPANAAWQRDLSVSLNKLGDLAVAQGDLPAAARLFSEARTIRERLAASDPANAEWQRDLSVSLVKLGELAVVQGDLAAAARLFSEARTIAERLAAREPANAAWQRDLSVLLNKLGDLAVAQGDLAAAARLFSGARTIRERLAASDPANAAWQRDLSLLLNKSGDLAVAQADLAAADRFFSEARTIAERLAASDPANAQWQGDLVASYQKSAIIAAREGRAGAATANFARCHLTLNAMREKKMHLDPALAAFLAQLEKAAPDAYASLAAGAVD